MADDEKVPPLDMEAALDIVLALPAHRSHNANHAAFGNHILNEYLGGMRASYKDDPVASQYLDNLLAAIFAAVRAFSVERDMFATRWDGISESKKADVERARRIDGYSPLSDDNYWKKALAVLAAAGLTVPAAGEIIARLSIGPLLLQFPVYIAGLVGFSLLVLLAADWVVFRYKAARIRQIEQLYPENVEKIWRQRSMERYRIILRKFLLSALILRETYYPHMRSIGEIRILETFKIPHVASRTSRVSPLELKPINELYPQLDEIVNRHLAFDE